MWLELPRHGYRNDVQIVLVDSCPGKIDLASIGSVGNNTAYAGGQFVFMNNGPDPTQWTTSTWSNIAQDLAFQVDGLVVPPPQATGVPAASTSLLIGLAGLTAMGLYQLTRSRQRTSS